MYHAIAMGKIAADGSIISATPGIRVRPTILPGNIYNSAEIGYTVRLPKRLVSSDKYIVQLTPENYGEDGPDYVTTTIAVRYQTKRSFEVLIWADRTQTIGTPGSNNYALVQSNFHFVIYEV